MAKLILSDVGSLASQVTAQNTINANNALIEAAMENTLSRDGTTPNTMDADIDINGNNLLNLPYPASDTEPIRLGDLTTLLEAADKVLVDSITSGDAAKLVKVRDDESGYEYSSITATDAGALAIPVSINIASTTTIDSVLDEDSLSSNSATALATQQSIKAYVDAQVTAQDLDFQGDSGGALSIDLDSETLTIAGTDGIVTSGTTNTLTVGTDAILQDLDTLGAAASDGQFIVATGAGAFAYESGDTARISLGVGTTDSPVFAGIQIGDATAGLFYDSTNDRIAIGAEEYSMTVAAGSVPSKFAVHSDGTEAVSEYHVHSTGSSLLDGPVIYGARSDGTEASPTIVVDTDYLFSIAAIGYDGTDYAQGGRIDFVVDGTPGAGDMPTSMKFYTSADGSETPTLALTIDPTQIATFANTPVVGANNVLDAGDLGVTVQAYDVDTLKADTADILTTGFATTSYSGGTVSSGTYTPDEANGNKQYITANGAFTLAVPTNDCNIELEITNGASAGSITTSSYTKVSGSYATTNTNKYLFYITKTQNYSFINIVDLN